MMRLRRTSILATTSCSALLMAAAPAGAASTVFGANTVTDELFCTQGSGYVSSYSAPRSGSITSFRFRSTSGQYGPSVGQRLDFKVFRSLGGGQFLVVGDSGPKTLRTGTRLEAFRPRAPIPVRAGDLLGFYTNTNLNGCMDSKGRHGGTQGSPYPVDPAPGATVPLPFSAQYSVNVSAVLQTAARPKVAARPSNGGTTSLQLVAGHSCRRASSRFCDRIARIRSAASADEARA